MTWLAECSASALGEALRIVAPKLSGYPVTVPGPAGKQDPLWHSGNVPVGDRFFVKFAWSRPAALQLAHEIGILAAGSRAPGRRRGAVAQRSRNPAERPPHTTAVGR